MKKTLFLLMILSVAAGLQAQRRYEDVLRQVESGNPMLQAARERSEAQQLEAHVGLMLPDPEVELSLFRGEPAEQGNRWDLRVTQSFEMPSVYVRRARLRNLREHAAELDYETIHNALMHEAQLICAEYVHAYNVAVIIDKQSTTAVRLRQLYEKRMATGDCSVLDYNRAKMYCAEMQDKATRSLLQAVHLKNDLVSLTGGSLPDISVESYDTVVLPLMFDEWYDTVEMHNPQLRDMQNMVEMSQQELQLSRSQWLPSMSVGYASETVTGLAYRGVVLGVKLPLWSQPRAVKQAKVSYNAAQRELQAKRLVVSDTLRCKIHTLLALQNNLNNFRRDYALYNSRDLLEKAFEAGELKLEQYLLQLDYYTQQELTLWEIAYELERGCIDLYAFTL